MQRHLAEKRGRGTEQERKNQVVSSSSLSKVLLDLPDLDDDSK